MSIFSVGGPSGNESSIQAKLGPVFSLSAAGEVKYSSLILLYVKGQRSENRVLFGCHVSVCS